MNQPLPWSESFAIGHPRLDAQHRRLVELINDIGDATRATANRERLAALVELLRVAAKEHFRQEDAILWEIRSGTYEAMKGRPRTTRLLEAMAEAAFDAHMAEHAILLDRFDAMVGADADALFEALKAWFLDHVIKQDSRLKAIFQAM